jgi:hypothetical protein
MVVVGRQCLLFVDDAKSSIGVCQIKHRRLPTLDLGVAKRQQCLLMSVYSF